MHWAFSIFMIALFGVILTLWQLIRAVKRVNGLNRVINTENKKEFPDFELIGEGRDLRARIIKVKDRWSISMAVTPVIAITSYALYHYDVSHKTVVYVVVTAIFIILAIIGGSTNSGSLHGPPQKKDCNLCGGSGKKGNRRCGFCGGTGKVYRW